LSFSIEDQTERKIGIGAARDIQIEQEGAPLSLREQVAQVYEESREDIYRYIVMMGIPREQAQEICQEGFLRLYAAMSNGQQIENLRAWAFTVARNQALALRTSLPAFASLEPAIEDRLAAESPSPEQSVLDREKLRRLREAIGLLSDQQRHCLHLRTKGFRYREIAEIIGVSTSTVGEVMQRAVRRLRKALYD
jgi:RNA polymerase sigma-70 factor (ECF subfamily)